MPENILSVQVAGDLLVDYQLYDGVRRSPQAPDGSTQLLTVSGGAGLLAKILRELAKQDTDPSGNATWRAELLYDDSEPQLQSMERRSFAVWRAFPAKPDDKQFVWRLSEPLGYSNLQPKDLSIRRPELAPTRAGIFVLDDAGKEFRHQSYRNNWPAALATTNKSEKPWVVLKMCAPLAQGDLWRVLRDNHQERLIVVAAIEDIRREEVLVTKGISWERAALDLAFELRCNPAIRDLLKCRHLIIAIGSEGALHVGRDASGSPKFHLLYDPQHLEGESAAGLEGAAVGFMSSLTSAIVRQIALLDNSAKSEVDSLRDGIKAGLSAMRRLRELGHGDTGSETPGFPSAEIASVIRGTTASSVRFESAEVPSPDESCLTQDAPWAIVTASQEHTNIPKIPLYGLAARVARNGLGQFGGVPYLRFGKLFTVDRSEIESLRSLQQLVVDYLRLDKGDKPLSLAVFGPPGAGKSFGVKQVSNAIYQCEYRKNAPILEFNLSQFGHPDELVGAFHAIRDKVLEGLTPVVFWDEFDSGEFTWLKNLLAPMQDGKFNEGQLTHPIGKCIFVLAGGTSYDFEHFGPPESDDAGHSKFRLLKGPDFKSRLSGYLNVLGPNPRLMINPSDAPSNKREWHDDPNDICFPIRRALLIRSAMGLKDNERLEMDSGILAALLELGHYRHGARSLEKIVQQLKAHRDGNTVRRSALPPRELVAMHADFDELRKIANRDLQFRSLGEEMAPHIHKAWRQNKIKAVTQKGGDLNFRYNCDFDNLEPWVHEENVAAAFRIPRILAMVGLRVAPLDDPADDSPDVVAKILQDHMEFLAEEEHDGWMEHKLRNGWRYGKPRDDAKRIHDNLIPYRDLADDIKQYDRDSITNYPANVQTAGFKIVRMGR